MQDAYHSPIRFSGPPSNLTAAVSIPRRGFIAPAIRVGDQLLPLVPGGDTDTITSLSFVLPPDVPPGEITGNIEIGERAQDAVIDVQPRPLVRFKPDHLVLRARAGATLEGSATVTNRGNDVVELDAGQRVELRRPDALSRGITTAFRDRRRDFAGKLIALGETLAEEQSVELPLLRCEPAGPLASGETRRLELAFEAPASLPAEARLSGSIALFGSRLRISLVTEGVR